MHPCYDQANFGWSWASSEVPTKHISGPKKWNIPEEINKADVIMEICWEIWPPTNFVANHWESQVKHVAWTFQSNIIVDEFEVYFRFLKSKWSFDKLYNIWWGFEVTVFFLGCKKILCAEFWESYKKGDIAVDTPLAINHQPRHEK